MPSVDESEREFRDRLTAILRATPPLMRVLSVARHLCLPDWLVFSGAVCQPVLNHLTGRPLDYGIGAWRAYRRYRERAPRSSFPSSDLLFVAVRARSNEPAAIWVFRPAA